MNIRAVVYDRVKSVAAQQRKVLSPLTDDLRILESGLDSLCLAILIANLDMAWQAASFFARRI